MAKRISGTPEQRFWANVQKTLGGCWIWHGPMTVRGYGFLSVAGKLRPAHRLGYELFVGPIPDGMTLDHTCHNPDLSCAGGASCRHRRCVNFEAHLEIVTSAVNTKRGGAARRTHCPQGHAYDEANTIVNEKTGHRFCRACRDIRNAARPTSGGRVYVRKTHCKRGHAFTADNTYHNNAGAQVCRTCKRTASRRSQGPNP